MDTNIEQKVSIALCTYNGERFLQEQLESIAAQTVLPFELVICDDASSDSTREILENFAAESRFLVRLYFNSNNLGYVKNFEKTISLCDGDIVFLSDQDDKWRPDKIAVMQKYFCDSHVGMVFSNASVINADGSPAGKFLWDQSHFDSKSREMFFQRKAYRELYLKNIVSGCTMAFRKSWWPYICPLPEDIPYIHDAWIAFMTSLFSEIVPVNQPLIEYRTHAQQSTATERQEVDLKVNIVKAQLGKKAQLYKNHLKQLHIIKERILQNDDLISLERRDYLLDTIADHQKHLETRIKIPHNIFVRYYIILKEWSTGRYGRFSNGYKSVITDLIKRSD